MLRWLRRRADRRPTSRIVLAVTVTGLAAAACQASRPAAAHAGSHTGGTITTVAGGPGGPGPATSLPLTVCGLAYSDGALYVGDASTVRRIDTRTGWLTTPAGDGTSGQRGVGGLATNAELASSDSPVGYSCGGLMTAVDPHGNLVIGGTSLWVVAAHNGDYYGRHMAAGHIYTVIRSLSDWTVSITVDRAGNVLLASTDYSACGSEQCYGATPGLVDVLAETSGTFYGRPMQAGRMYRIAGSETARRSGNDGPAVRAALGTLSQISLDAAGNVLIADEGNPASFGPPVLPPQIRVLAARDGTFYGQPMKAGDIYAIAGGGASSGDGVPATDASLSGLELGVTRDAAGNVVIGDNRLLRVVAVRDGTFYGQTMKAGDIYSVAGGGRGGLGSGGDGGPALQARIGAALVAVDGAGNLVFADAYGGDVRVVAARSGVWYGVAMRAGRIYRVAGSAGPPPLGVPAASALIDPASVAADPSGDIVIGGGPVTFVPARPGRYFGVAMRAGSIYPLPTTTGGGGRCGCQGAATADRQGNVLIADQASHQVMVAPARSGTFYGQRMRAGRVYPVAGDGSPFASGDGGLPLAAGMQPIQVAADRHGNLFVVDNAGDYSCSRCGIRMIPARAGFYYGIAMKAGRIYTVAGGSGGGLLNAVPATQTGMSPDAVAVDAAGNLVLASDNRIRVVAARSGRFYGQDMKTGYIYTVAGPFPGAHDVAIDGRGDILLADASADVVRLLAARSGEVYGQRVTAGRLYVVAGRQHGRAALGEGGPATGAWLGDPVGIAVDPAGRLLIADNASGRIRAVQP